MENVLVWVGIWIVLTIGFKIMELKKEDEWPIKLVQILIGVVVVTAGLYWHYYSSIQYYNSKLTMPIPLTNVPVSGDKTFTMQVKVLYHDGKFQSIEPIKESVQILP